AAQLPSRAQQRDDEEEQDHHRAGVHDDLRRENELRAQQQVEDREGQHHHNQAEDRADRLVEGDNANATQDGHRRRDEKDGERQLLLFLSVKTRLHVRRHRLEQLLLGVDELLTARVGELVLRAQHDRLHRARVLAVAAKDAAQHVDLVGLRVALTRRDALLLGVLRRDDEDAADRTCGGAQLTSDAPLEPVVVTAQIVAAAIPLGPRGLVLRIHERDWRLHRLPERGPEPFQQRADVTGDVRLFPFHLPARRGGRRPTAAGWGRSIFHLPARRGGRRLKAAGWGRSIFHLPARRGGRRLKAAGWGR